MFLKSNIDMSDSVQYIINETGERVGVVYVQLSSSLTSDPECLVGLDLDQLQALASCKLAQKRLDDLVTRNAQSLLSGDELAELDELLAKADQLTILKTRAKYTSDKLSLVFNRH